MLGTTVGFTRVAIVVISVILAAVAASGSGHRSATAEVAGCPEATNQFQMPWGGGQSWQSPPAQVFAEFSEDRGVHSGEDWRPPGGNADTPVYPIGPGRLVFLSTGNSTVGGIIIIEHGGSLTIPAHSGGATTANTYSYDESSGGFYSVYLHVVPTASLLAQVGDGYDASNDSGVHCVTNTQQLATLNSSTNTPGFLFSPHLHLEIRTAGFSQWSASRTLVLPQSNWHVSSIGYINAQQMVVSGFRDPSTVINANLPSGATSVTFNINWGPGPNADNQTLARWGVCNGCTPINLERSALLQVRNANDGRKDAANLLPGTGVSILFDSSGNASYVLPPVIQPGRAYDLYLWPSGFLRQKVTMVLNTGANSVHFNMERKGTHCISKTEVTTLMMGDVDANNVVNSLDYNTIIRGIQGLTSQYHTIVGGESMDELDLNLWYYVSCILGFPPFSQSVFGDGGFYDARFLIAASASDQGPAEASVMSSALGSMTLTPSSGAYEVGDQITVTINADSAGALVDGVDVVLDYDPVLMRVIEMPTSTSLPRMQVALENEQTGIVRIVGLTDSPTAVSGPFATVVFEAVQPGLTDVELEFISDSGARSSMPERFTGSSALGLVNGASFIIKGPSNAICDPDDTTDEGLVNTIVVGQTVTCTVQLSPGATMGSWSALFDWEPAASANSSETFTARGQSGGTSIVVSWNEYDGSHPIENWQYIIEEGPPLPVEIQSHQLKAVALGNQILVFGRSPQNELWARGTDAAGDFVTDWVQIATGVASRPTIALFATGEGIMFWRGIDNDLILLQESAPESLGGVVAGNPVAAVDGDGDVIVMVLNGAGNLFYQRLANGVWSGYQSLFGVLDGQLELVEYQGDLHLFAYNQAGLLWTRVWNHTTDTWGDWTPLDGVLTGGPAAAVYGSDLYVYGINPEGILFYRALSGGTWAPWTPLDGVLGDAPDVASTASEQIVLGTNLGGNLWERTNTGSFGGWTPLDGVLATGPEVVAVGDSIYAFGLNADGNLWYRKWNGSSWEAWTNLGGILATE